MNQIVQLGQREAFTLPPGLTRMYIDETMSKSGGRLRLATKYGKSVHTDLYRWVGPVTSSAFTPLCRQMERLPIIVAATFDPTFERKEDRHFVLKGWQRPGWFLDEVLNGKEVNSSPFKFHKSTFTGATILNFLNEVWD